MQTLVHQFCIVPVCSSHFSHEMDTFPHWKCGFPAGCGYWRLTKIYIYDIPSDRMRRPPHTQLILRNETTKTRPKSNKKTQQIIYLASKSKPQIMIIPRTTRPQPEDIWHWCPPGGFSQSTFERKSGVPYLPSLKWDPTPQMDVKTQGWWIMMNPNAAQKKNESEKFFDEDILILYLCR